MGDQAWVEPAGAVLSPGEHPRSQSRRFHRPTATRHQTNRATVSTLSLPPPGPPHLKPFSQPHFILPRCRTGRRLRGINSGAARHSRLPRNPSQTRSAGAKGGGGEGQGRPSLAPPPTSLPSTCFAFASDLALTMPACPRMSNSGPSSRPRAGRCPPLHCAR